MLRDYFRKLEEDAEYREIEQKNRLRLDLAEVVIRARLQKGWTQKELAQKVGTKQANISRIESGIANVTLNMIQNLFLALDINWFMHLHNEQLTQTQATINESASANGPTEYLSINLPMPCNPQTQLISEAPRSKSKVLA